MPMPRKPDPLLMCKQCGATMRRKEINGRVEDLAVFRRRKYCDRRCMARAFIKIDPTLSALRVRAHKSVKRACDVCEATKHLGVHHLDEDVTNNAPENTPTLCNSCHQIWHWHFGKVRPSRKRA